jgi:hypothetical protein
MPSVAELPGLGGISVSDDFTNHLLGVASLVYIAVRKGMMQIVATLAIKITLPQNLFDSLSGFGCQDNRPRSLTNEFAYQFAG